MPGKSHLASCLYCGKEFWTSNKFRFHCSLGCRFWDKIAIGDISICWPYLEGINIDGYGKFIVNCKEIKAHRFAWENLRGPIPRGILVLHACDNPACCNPKHLFLGTPKDNSDDMIAKGRRRSDIGSLNPQAKLKELEVVEIKKLLSLGKTLKFIGNKFHVSSGTIFDIKYNKTWTHVYFSG